jgi:hypothetical protein
MTSDHPDNTSPLVLPVALHEEVRSSLWIMQSSAIDDLSVLGERERVIPSQGDAEGAIAEFGAVIGRLSEIHDFFHRIGRQEPEQPTDIALHTANDQGLALEALTLRIDGERDSVCMGVLSEEKREAVRKRIEMMKTFVDSAAATQARQSQVHKDAERVGSGRT